MDEILIEEKKYVSSKRAAKITGYAKDYIGQLCREGRVPARLVGRSWYVLESAIQDHRFGEPAEESKESITETSVFGSRWETPRYDSAEAENIPSVNKLSDTITLKKNAEIPHSDTKEAKEAPSKIELPNLRKDTEQPIPTPAPTEADTRGMSEPSSEKEVLITQNTPKLTPKKAKIKRNTARIIMGIFGIVAALLFSTLALLNSGVADQYFENQSTLYGILGISVYSK